MIRVLALFVFMYIVCCKAERASFCYGDNSFSSNFVNISCAVGVIRVRDIVAASKPQTTGCPLFSHTYTPSDHTQCCTYLDGDCLQVYAGPDNVYQRFLSCNGQSQCDGIQVVWQQNSITCNTLGTFPFVTNYMIFDFDCVPDGKIDGLCSDTLDCTVTYSHCNNTLCDCNDTYTELHDACYPDVNLNGNCGANTYCSDPNTVCKDGTCVCDTHFAESGGVCLKDTAAPERSSFCRGTGFSDRVHAACSEGVIFVTNVLTASKPTAANCPDLSNGLGPAEYERCCSYTGGDCIQTYQGEISGYLTCNGKKMCDGMPAVQQRTDPACSGNFSAFSNYVILEYTCVQDGQINGACNDTVVCIPDNATCKDNKCTCDPGYSNVDGTCWKDGHINGACNDTADCVPDNAECTDNRCTCNTSYSHFDGVCWKDTHLGGSCVVVSDCVDPDTVCTDGRCLCAAGYTDIGGMCKQDGSLGGYCQRDSDCSDANANCNQQFICVCKNLYTSFNGVCIEDGEPEGKCLSSGQACTDAHSICIDGVCKCNDERNYQLKDGQCVRNDGQINGACNDTVVCIPDNATCKDNKCTCDPGYSNIDGTCWKDGHINGACNDTVDCMPNNAECTDNRCICNTSYSYFDGGCWKDTHLGGSCVVSSDCVDPDTVCTDGRCLCAAGYTDIGGMCKQDGSLGGYCQRDSDCSDANANCNQQFICVCKNLYTSFNGVCIEDGEPEGKCLSSGQACTDVHSICIDGVCKCNDVRNYQLKDGQCVRNDTYIHGACAPGSACIDPNTNCINGKCSCKTHYVEQNGHCIRDTVSHVTSCVGASPYNVLQPDCHPGMSSLTVRETNLYKTVPASCPAVFDVYNEALFQQCCLYNTSDCQPSVSTCNGPNNYQLKEYKCVNDSSHTVIDSNSTVSGQPVYLTGPRDKTSSSGTCSIQASCLTIINVYLVALDLKESGGVCRQRVTISEGSNTTNLTCLNNTAVQVPVFTATSGYMTVSWLNNDNSLHGTFILEYEATDSQVILDISCGSSLQQKTSISQCTRIGAGLISQPCLVGGVCLNATAHCVDDVCVCKGGYTLSDGDCRSTTGGEDDGGGSNSTVLMAILIPLSLMLLIAVALIVFCLCRDKFCRKKPEEKPSIEPVAVVTPYVERHPTPARTNFGGRIPEDASKPPLKRRQTLLEFVKKEAEYDDVTKKNLNRQQTYYPGMTGMDSNVNTRFQRYFNPRDPQGPIQTVVTAKPPLATSAPPAKSVDEVKEKKRKKKRLKKLKRKARIGILAAKGFELPRDVSQTKEGTYTRTAAESDPYAIGYSPKHPPLRTRQTESALPNVPPDAYAPNFSQSVGPTAPPGRLPPLKRHTSAYFPYKPDLSQTLPASAYTPVYPVERVPNMGSFYSHPSPAPYIRPHGSQSYYFPRPNMMQQVPGSPTSPFEAVGQSVESGYFHPPPHAPPGGGSYMDMPPHAPPGGGSFMDMPSQAPPTFNPHSAWRRAGVASSIAARPNLMRRRSTLEISSFDTDDPLETADLD